MKFELKGNIQSKMGRYTSIFSRDYQKRRSIYDASIRNWTIEYSDPFFMVQNSDGDIEFVYRGSVVNCTCSDFIQNESGTCMHIEAIDLIPHRDLSSIGRKSESVRFVDFSGKSPSIKILKKRGTEGFLNLPSSRLYEDWKKNSDIHEYDISGIENWNPFEEFGINLYDYQEYSVKRMIKSRRSVLALKMGLGKTICSLAACKILSKDKILIICPNNLKYQWVSEIERFNLGESLVLDKSSDLSKYTDQRFLILSYEMLNRNSDLFSTFDFDIMIADEIQKIKNQESVSWKSMSRINTDFIFSLSGTPVQNSINDILSIVGFLNPYEFKPKWKFWEEYCEFSRAKILGIKKSKVSDFREKIFRYMINPKISKDAIKLPSVKEQEISCTLDSDSNRLHNTYLDIARPIIAKSFNYPLTFGERAKLNALLTKARMASTDSRLIDPMGGKSHRFSTIEKLISEIVNRGEKVIIYSEWIKSTKLLTKYLVRENIQYSLFNGDMLSKKREFEKNRFLKDDSVKVFLSTDSGGLGIDGLQLASNNIIHIEKVWNPAKIKQRNGRLVRNLQKSELVNIYYVTCNSEVEKMIDSSSFRKSDLITDIIG